VDARASSAPQKKERHDDGRGAITTSKAYHPICIVQLFTL
jgi:hypothetical protein